MEPKLHEALQENKFSRIVDPRLRRRYNHDEMKMMIACAAACIRHFPQERPPISRVWFFSPQIYAAATNYLLEIMVHTCKLRCIGLVLPFW